MEHTLGNIIFWHFCEEMTRTSKSLLRVPSLLRLYLYGMHLEIMEENNELLIIHGKYGFIQGKQSWYEKSKITTSPPPPNNFFFQWNLPCQIIQNPKTGKEDSPDNLAAAKVIVSLQVPSRTRNQAKHRQTKQNGRNNWTENGSKPWNIWEKNN